MAPITILPRAIVRNSFDMGGLLAYALAAVNERGLRGLRHLRRFSMPQFLS
jgi:hypothetical protein